MSTVKDALTSKQGMNETIDRVCRGVASVQEGEAVRAYISQLERTVNTRLADETKERTYCDCPVGTCQGGPINRCVYRLFNVDGTDFIKERAQVEAEALPEPAPCPKCSAYVKAHGGPSQVFHGDGPCPPYFSEKATGYQPQCAHGYFRGECHVENCGYFRGAQNGTGK
jgi:hypothetical protein